MRSHAPRPRLIMASAGSSLLAFLIPTTFSIGLIDKEAPPPNLPDPHGCVSAPLPLPSPDDAPAPPVDFTVTVATKNATHPYFGVGWSEGFVINGTQGLELFLVRGTLYTFSVTGGHPFVFTTNSVGGPANIGASYPNGNGITGTPGTGNPSTVTFTPNASHPSLIYYNCNAHNNMGWKIHISDPAALVAAKVLLNGPYNSTTQLMLDSLRKLNLIPTDEPYSDLGISVITATVSPSVLSIATNNAIVDWVDLELRDAGTPSTLVMARAALVQRDGDVVSATNGTSPVTFTVAPGNYYVVIRHRNHLGVMTAAPVALSAIATTVDFTSASTLCYGGADTRRTIGTKMVLWSGDAAFDGQIQYTGAGADAAMVLTAIGGVIPTASVTGQYRMEDVTMDGAIKYTGAGSDRDMMLQSIGGLIPTIIRYQEIP